MILDVETEVNRQICDLRNLQTLIQTFKFSEAYPRAKDRIDQLIKLIRSEPDVVKRQQYFDSLDWVIKTKCDKEDLNIKTLKAWAQQLGITNYSRLNKAELAAAIGGL